MLKELKLFLPVAKKVKGRHSPVLPILDHLCVQDRMMRVTDLETMVVVPIDDKESYTLPIYGMDQILKQKPEVLRCVVGENCVVVTFGKSEMTPGQMYSVTFGTRDPKEYLHIPKEKFEKVGIWTKEIFSQLYKQLKFVLKKVDEIRIELTGVLVRQDNNIFETCATNGHILRYVNFSKYSKYYKIMRELTGIIPTKAIMATAKFLRGDDDVSVYKSENYIKFELRNGIKIFSELIRETYPDFERLLDYGIAELNKVNVDKGDFLRAINTCKPFVPSSKLVVLSTQNDGIAMSAKDSGKWDYTAEANTYIPRSGSSKELRVGFNINYLEKVIKSIDGDQILWYYSDPLVSSIFRSPQDTGEICVLMPVRLNDEADK